MNSSKTHGFQIVAWAVVTLALVGCESAARLEPVRARTVTQGRAAMERFYQPMVVNAAAQDMSIADFHFVPHTTVLNNTGEVRLDMLLGILDQHGGIVRYDTPATDEKMIQSRLDSIRSYLADAGCDMSRVDVKTMLSGGRGMSAASAMEIAARGTTGAGAAAGGNP